ncbi:hypothetical protein E4N62_34720 [Streptomyces sp. MNU76]|uniref:hypothetical protein n=1 Tax=Streptomyces sp. MNU76 TaxID=2560026 RepID=UPI001E5CD749|nr:hypothetical protein [Streptomyces sp. MNU76]MCC9709966.1 hypothetical protein [Streptomyces sp. MNU76]
MSYDLAGWDGARPLDDDQACSVHDELHARHLESDEVTAPPTPAIAAYVEALLQRYPDDIDGDTVRASPPVVDEASGPIVHLVMSYRAAQEVLDHAASLAHEHGLVCYDPQVACLRA